MDLEFPHWKVRLLGWIPKECDGLLCLCPLASWGLTNRWWSVSIYFFINQLAFLVSIAENNIENSFNIYPVPAKNGDVTVYFKNVEDLNSLVLYNVNGQNIREILKTQFQDNKIVLSDLDKGFYVLKATIFNTVIAKKIIVN